MFGCWLFAITTRLYPTGKDNHACIFTTIIVTHQNTNRPFISNK